MVYTNTLPNRAETMPTTRLVKNNESGYSEKITPTIVEFAPRCFSA